MVFYDVEHLGEESVKVFGPLFNCVFFEDVFICFDNSTLSDFSFASIFSQSVPFVDATSLIAEFLILMKLSLSLCFFLSWILSLALCLKLHDHLEVFLRYLLGILSF